MGVTFIAPQGTYTAPAKLVTKEITENGTYDPADDNANGYSSVTVEVEGGGGSSDFSTAILSIVDNGGYCVNLDVATINERGFSLGGYTEWFSTDDLPVILYKGNALLELKKITATNISISGDIENLEGDIYAITGDCTITIS